MMQCFGQYSADRLCNICSKIDEDIYDNCFEIFIEKEIIKSRKKQLEALQELIGGEYDKSKL